MAKSISLDTKHPIHLFNLKASLDNLCSEYGKNTLEKYLKNSLAGEDFSQLKL